jgi:hypothetical protein
MRMLLSGLTRPLAPSRSAHGHQWFVPSNVTTTDDVLTRLATEADAEAIARVYNQGIEERIATFETRPRTTTEIVQSLRDRSRDTPPSWPKSMVP